jgi:hypothetical protein
MTVANLLKAPLVSTSGTIDSLTTGTTTSTAEIVTNGTIATLNSTTGTIANLSATTSTFLGTITGSTNVINIGSGQIYKDASGNVGIGTNGPSRKLTIVSNSADTQLTIGTTSPSFSLTNQAANPNTATQTAIIALATSPGDFGINSGDLLIGMVGNSRSDIRIDSNYSGTGTKNVILQPNTGNVGIGTSSPATKLSVVASSNSGINVTNGTMTGILFNSSDTSIAIGTTSNHPVALYSNNTERLRIDAANGTLTSQPTYDNTAAGSTVVVTSAGLIRRTSSSLKYKKDIENLDSSIVDNAIDRLRPVWYRTKNPEGDDKSTWSHVGLIAEEVDSVEPRLVKYKTVEVSINENGERIETQLENPVPEDVDYARLSVVLLSEVKAQRVKIASLEARLEALEAK